MIRRLILTTGLAAVLTTAMLTNPSATRAQTFITGPYFYDPTPPRAGYFYPGVPFANRAGVPYYQGYGAPYYPGYGPPYTANYGQDYITQRYVTPYTATTNAYGYYGY
jgi:hypothetical protein